MLVPPQRKLRAPWIALLCVLLIAFALRLFRIAQQSIWYDEGLSLYYARGSLTQVLADASQTEHPPLHPLMLNLWVRVCGDSELAVRMLSVCWGMVAIALVYRLGQRFLPGIAAPATLLLAVSPLAIWYSQETRGYMLALALQIGLFDCALSLFPIASGSPRHHGIASWARYLLYAVLGASALYAHLYSAPFLVALNLAFLVRFVRLVPIVGLRRLWPHAAKWALSQVAVAALFAPWLPSVLAQLQANATFWHGAVGWRQIAGRTLVALSVGETLSGAWATAATWVLSLLALLGTYALARQPRRPSWASLWLWVVIPILLQVLINQTRPKFAVRYLIGVLPAYLLLASAGVRWLFAAARRYAFRPAGWAASAAILLSTAVVGGATARSLGAYYLDSSLYRPDFRAVAAYIQQHGTPDDLIVLLGGHSYPAFTYYYRQALPVLPLPDRLLPSTREPVDVSVLETLDQAIAGKQRLWLVLWQPTLADPTGLVVDELEQTYHRLGVGQTFHDIGLLLFDVSPGPLLSAHARPSSPLVANLGDQVQLLGYRLPTATIKPGGTLYLYLYWQSLTAMRHDYKVFVQVLDEHEQIVAQLDRIAGAEAYPTSHWAPGAIVRERFLLTIPPQVPAGSYSLIVGLYDPTPDMPRLPVQGQGAGVDHVLLTQIEVRDR